MRRIFAFLLPSLESDLSIKLQVKWQPSGYKCTQKLQKESILTVSIWHKKLAKARKTRKSLSTLDLKKFGPGKLRVEKVWAQNIFIHFLADFFQKKTLIQPISGNPCQNPKLKNNWGPLSSTCHVEQPETLVEWKFESVTDLRIMAVLWGSWRLYEDHGSYIVDHDGYMFRGRC